MTGSGEFGKKMGMRNQDDWNQSVWKNEERIKNEYIN